MNKVLVEVQVPAIGDHFDIFVPTDAQIRDLIGIMADGVAELSNEKYIPSGCEQLCLKEPAGLLNPTLTLEDYGIKDGTQLYLI